MVSSFSGDCRCLCWKGYVSMLMWRVFMLLIQKEVTTQTSKHTWGNSPSPKQMGIQFIAYLDCGEKTYVVCATPGCASERWEPVGCRSWKNMLVKSEWKSCPIFGWKIPNKYWKWNHLVNQKPLPNVRNLNFPEHFANLSSFCIS